MVPLHATLPFGPPLCTGEEHEADIEMGLRPAIWKRIILRHGDELFSTTPWALIVILAAKDIYVSARTRGYACFFVQMTVCFRTAPDVCRGACPGERAHVRIRTGTRYILIIC